MIDGPLVSVVVPVFNAEKTLPACFESITNQTHRHLQILLVDDGSNDESLALCRECENLDKRVTVIPKKNGGVSSARNAGIDKAQGEYIVFVDSDDVVHPEYLEKMLAYRRDDALVMCGYEEFLDDMPSFAEVGSNCGYELIDPRYCLNYWDSGIASPFNKLFDAGVVESNHIRFPDEIALGEDLLFVLMYLGCILGGVLKLGRNLYGYRRGADDSLSGAVPTADQTEFFYRKAKVCLDQLEADSTQYEYLRYKVMLDYEKLLIAIARNESKSFMETVRELADVFKAKTYREVCTSDISSNAIYRKVLRGKNPFLAFAWYRLSR